MTAKDKILYELNALIATDVKTQYQEGKQDGLNIAVREMDSFMNAYRVYLDNGRGAETVVIVFAKTPIRAEEFIIAEAKQFPEFKKEVVCTTNYIGLSDRTEEGTIWM